MPVLLQFFSNNVSQCKSKEKKPLRKQDEDSDC